MRNKNMVVENLPQIFKENIETLKNTSYDKENKVYMTESEIKVINFDKVKESYIRDNIPKVNPIPTSSDAIFISKEGKLTFIEFKNGRIKNDEVYKVRWKIYDSLLILFDMGIRNEYIKFEDKISYTRNNVDYILVYNEQKYEKNGPTRLCGEGEQRQKKKLQQSNSRDYFNKRLLNMAGENFIKFGLDCFKGYFFKNVFTYSQKEFEENFVNINS